MKKIPVRYAPVLFGGLLSAIMVMVVSGVVLLINQGYHSAFFGQWGRSFITTWPIAFPVVLVVAPVVRKWVAWLTGQTKAA